MKSTYIKIIKILLLIFSLSGLIVFASPADTYRDLGENAWNILIVVMFIRPLRDIFPKCRIFKFISKFRRELGILVGVFALAHTIGAFMEYMVAINYTKTYLQLFFDKYVWDYAGFMFYGMLAFLISVPLLITSNGISTSLLGKNWKTLQRLSYFMFILVAVHMAMIPLAHGNSIDYGPLSIVGIWIIVYIIAFVKNKFTKNTLSSGVKWLCVPCGYIYDESIGDPDSGIAPGTKFENIPDDWRCPVCGVSKKDFIPYDEQKKQETIKAEVISYNMLTSDVLELIVRPCVNLKSIPGQYVNFLMKDNDGEFRRSYSIVEDKNGTFTFGIKLTSEGRGSKILKNIKVGDNLEIIGVFGEFVLKNTTNPKLFIATGTGLSPILNMLSTSIEAKKYLLFGLANKSDVFYEDKIKMIDKLDYKIYLSREQVPGYKFGRIDLSKFGFTPETEFYICGNPAMVKANIDYLTEKGFKNIYSEKFE